MTRLFTFAFAAFLASYTAVALIRRVALRLNVLSIPNGRSSHRLPIPTCGGVGIVVVVLTFLGISGGIGDVGNGPFVAYLIGAIIIAAVGCIDDVWHLSALKRLAMQTIAAAVLLTWVRPPHAISLPFLGTWNWGWLGIPATMFWIIGLINAYNFMDGIDGIAAGQAIVAGAMWGIVSISAGLSGLSTLSMLLVGASLGFLMHNIHPARIFMGDVGSTFLGYTFAALPLLAAHQTHDTRLFFAGGLAVCPFALDATFTMARRIYNREDLLRAHRSHLYQRLVQRGYSHTVVSSLYTALAAGTAILGIVYLE